MKQIKKFNSIKKAAFCRQDTTGNISQNSFPVIPAPSLSAPCLAALGSDGGFKADPTALSILALTPPAVAAPGQWQFLRIWLLSTPEQNSTEALEPLSLQMLHKNLSKMT